MVRVSIVLDLHTPNSIELDNTSLVFNHAKDEKRFRYLEENSYKPTLSTLLNMVNQTDFKFAISVSGTFLEQCARFDSQIPNILSELLKTKKIELLRQTYHSTYAAFYKNASELKSELKNHEIIVKDLVGTNALGRVVKNPQLAYSNSIGQRISMLGFRGVISEQAQGTNPYEVYNVFRAKTRILFRAKELSKDIAFRMLSTTWNQYPLTAEKYLGWISSCNGRMAVLCFDATNFGIDNEYRRKALELLSKLPQARNNYHNIRFELPTRIAGMRSSNPLSIEGTLAWDEIPTFEKMERLKNSINKSNTGIIKELWKNLQTHENLSLGFENMLEDKAENKLFSKKAFKSSLFLETSENHPTLNQSFNLSDCFLGCRQEERRYDHDSLLATPLIEFRELRDEKYITTIAQALSIMFGDSKDELEMYSDSNAFLSFEQEEEIHGYAENSLQGMNLLFTKQENDNNNYSLSNSFIFLNS